MSCSANSSDVTPTEHFSNNVVKEDGQSRTNAKRIRSSEMQLEHGNSKKTTKNKKGPEFETLNCEYVFSMGSQFESNAEQVIRHVKPYLHTYNTFAKGRWLGRRLLEVFCREFGGYSADYWVNALKLGFVRVNGALVTGDYELKNGDRVSHVTHRHEPPIKGVIKLVGIHFQRQETTEMTAAVDSFTQSGNVSKPSLTSQSSDIPEIDLVSVYKPASLPMHPCGSYSFNSLQTILAREPLFPQQPRPLYQVHRLDRLTSGLVVLAASKEAAHRVSQQILHGHTLKYYVARVRGKFPDVACQSMFQPLTGTELEKVKSSSLQRPEDDDGELSDIRPTNRPAEVVDIHAPIKRIAPPLDDVRRCKTGRVTCGIDPKLPEWLLLSCPLAILSYREGVYCNDPESSLGRESLSAFKSLGYDRASDTSLVLCRPLTGRYVRMY